MSANSVSTGHSAIVHMELRVNGQVLPIGQLGPHFLVLENPADHPPVESAEIVMSIDSKEERWLVCLPDGIRSDRRKTAIARCSNVNGATAGSPGSRLESGQRHP
jgi:hypothetical protein